ncbi:glycosyltransferase family 4 protein [Candidatus Uhrbacteria bacterium]|nr:glycosyltransferase family 4 protein [Candidatus Uhrbacteria bacterium]
MLTLGIDAFISRKEWSGVEWYTYHLLRAMTKMTPPDWRVFLYSMDLPQLPVTDYQLPITNPVWQWRRLAWPPKRGWREMRLSWEMLRRPPDVFFASGGPIPFWHPHGKKGKTVTTIHDVAFLSHSERYQPMDFLRQKLALSRAIHQADLIFTPSEATRNELWPLLHGEPPVSVTPLGVDHERYHTKPISEDRLQNILQQYRLSQPYLFYVGRLDAKKNLETLIEAYVRWTQRAPRAGAGEEPLRLALAGPAGWKSEILQNLIRERRAENLVRWIGFVAEEDLPLLYRGAHAFVFPSLAEGFGLPVLQALSCGLPTLASDIPALHEVAGEAALFADPNSVEAWTESLECIINDQTLRQKFAVSGPLRSQSFSWDRTAKLTWEGIMNVIE